MSHLIALLAASSRDGQFDISEWKFFNVIYELIQLANDHDVTANSVLARRDSQVHRLL